MDNLNSVLPSPISRLDASERSREPLLAAVRQSIALHGLSGISLKQVIEQAGVSQAAFYHVFESLEQACDQVLHELLAELEIQFRERHIKADPAANIACQIWLFLIQAQEDPLWARLIVQYNTHRHETMLGIYRETLGALVAEGVKKGQFTVEADRAALDLVMGTVLAALHTILESNADDNYIHQVIAHILRGLGMLNRSALERALRLAGQSLPRS